MDPKGGESPIPRVRDDDPDEVADGLSIAAARWSQGDLADALVWLRRAAAAASDAEADLRALELAKASSALADALASSRPAGPASAAPPSAAAPAAPAAPPVVPSVAPPAAPPGPPPMSQRPPSAPKPAPTPSRPSAMPGSRPPTTAPKPFASQRPGLAPLPPMRPLGTASTAAPAPTPATTPRPAAAAPVAPAPPAAAPATKSRPNVGAPPPASRPPAVETASAREARRASAELPSLIGDDGYEHEQTSQMPVAELLRRLEQGRESEADLRAAEIHESSQEFQPDVTQTIDAPRDMGPPASHAPIPAPLAPPVSVPMDYDMLRGEPPALAIGVYVRVVQEARGVVVIPDSAGATRGIRAILVPLDANDDLRGVFDGNAD
jgi:hypothetical protein